MKSVLALALVVVAGFFGLGVLLLAARSADSAMPTAAPSEASASTSSEDPMSNLEKIAQAVVKPKGPIAPEIASTTWLNSPPLASADLRGKVVVVEFWTYG